MRSFRAVVAHYRPSREPRRVHGFDGADDSGVGGTADHRRPVHDDGRLTDDRRQADHDGPSNDDHGQSDERGAGGVLLHLGRVERRRRGDQRGVPEHHDPERAGVLRGAGSDRGEVRQRLAGLQLARIGERRQRTSSRRRQRTPVVSLHVRQRRERLPGPHRLQRCTRSVRSRTPRPRCAWRSGCRSTGPETSGAPLRRVRATEAVSRVVGGSEPSSPVSPQGRPLSRSGGVWADRSHLLRRRSAAAAQWRGLRRDGT